MACLEREFGFHPLAIEDIAFRNQRPKLDAYDDYLFIVLHFPVFDKSQDRLLTAELDLFVGPDYLITLPDQNLPPLAAMFERYPAARDHLGCFLCNLVVGVRTLYTLCFPYLMLDPIFWNW